MSEEWIGVVEHYYPRVGAAVLKIDQGDLHVGDKIHIFGHGTDLVEEVRSLQLDRHTVQVAHAGDHVGVRLSFRVPEKTDVFIVRPMPQHADFHERYAEAWDPSY